MLALCICYYLREFLALSERSVIGASLHSNPHWLSTVGCRAPNNGDTNKSYAQDRSSVEINKRCTRMHWWRLLIVHKTGTGTTMKENRDGLTLNKFLHIRHTVMSSDLSRRESPSPT